MINLLQRSALSTQLKSGQAPQINNKFLIFTYTSANQLKYPFFSYNLNLQIFLFVQYQQKFLEGVVAVGEMLNIELPTYAEEEDCY